MGIVLIASPRLALFVLYSFVLSLRQPFSLDFCKYPFYIIDSFRKILLIYWLLFQHIRTILCLLFPFYDDVLTGKREYFSNLVPIQKAKQKTVDEFLLFLLCYRLFLAVNIWAECCISSKYDWHTFIISFIFIDRCNLLHIFFS